MVDFPRQTLNLLAAAAWTVAVLVASEAGGAATTPAEPQTLENSHLRVSIDPQAGTLRVVDKASSQQWFSAHSREGGGEPRFRSLSRLPGSAPAVSFEADFGSTDKRPNEPDSEPRDYEQIPLLEEGGIETFIRREVLPYTPDAWIVEADTKIGYEVSFTRHFYKPTQLCTLAEMSADILA